MLQFLERYEIMTKGIEDVFALNNFYVHTPVININGVNYTI